MLAVGEVRERERKVRERMKWVERDYSRWQQGVEGERNKERKERNKRERGTGKERKKGKEKERKGKWGKLREMEKEGRWLERMSSGGS